MSNLQNNNRAAGSITADDVINPVALAIKLQAGDHPYSQFLLQKFSVEGQAMVAKAGDPGTDPSELAGVLAREFSTLVAGGQSLHDPGLINGTPLRKGTQKLLKKNPQGHDLVRLNTRLIQDYFTGDLDHDSCEFVEVVKKKGIEFRIYKERRKLKTIWNVSYKIVFPATAEGTTSTHAPTLEEAYVEIENLLDRILTGQTPITKQEAKDRDAKAKAYDEIATEAAKVGKTTVKDILEFIQGAVKAQLLLGLARPLLEFIIHAIELMVKPVKPQMLQACVEKYCAFIDGRRDVEHKTRRRQKALIRKFALEIPAWVHARQLKESQPNERTEEPMSSDVLADQIETNDIQGWLNSSSTGWRSRRYTLDSVRAFMVYCRDVLHAIPPGLKTAAHGVPRPKPDSDFEPVPAAVLSWRNVWRILINLQDFESVLFFGLAVFAGLHQSEILRLVWEYDIKWDKGYPIQVFIASGKGKDKQGNRLGVWVDIREPLRSILALGKGRTGKIIHRNSIRQEKLAPLAKQLGIEWEESIMRHTFISNLFGLGFSFEQVARQARNTVTVLKRHYYAPIPKPEAQRFFLAPVVIHWPGTLPWQLRDWKWNTLHEFEENPDGTASIQRSAIVLPARVANRPRNPRRRQTPIAWPCDLELQVALWDRPQDFIARELQCRQTTVSSYAKKRGLIVPKSDYYARIKHHLPVSIPDAVLKARETLAARKASQSASPGGSSGQSTNPDQSNGTCSDQSQQPLN